MAGVWVVDIDEWRGAGRLVSDADVVTQKRSVS